MNIPLDIFTIYKIELQVVANKAFEFAAFNRNANQSDTRRNNNNNMPIDSDFPKNYEVIGKHKHSDGEHFHFVWDQVDQMLKHQPSQRSKKHTKQEEKSMFH